MTDALACNPVSAVFNHAPKKPIALLLSAVVLTLSCGATYVATPLGKTAGNGCDGDKVAVESGIAKWASPVGEIDIQPLNMPTPKAICVVKLDAAQAAAFDEQQRISWADFEKWKQQNG